MHHSFDINLAAQYGVTAALIIHHFQHWIRVNKSLNRNFHEGKTWSYQTLDEIAAHFPYLSKSEVFDAIERLCLGRGRRSKKEELEFEPVLEKGNFNKTNFDKTTWYAFKNEEKFIVLAQAKIAIGSSQNRYRSEPTPIPDTKPYTKTEVVCVEAAPSTPQNGVLGSRCKKKHPDGHHFEVSLEEVISWCITNKKNFSVDLIHEAWNKLCSTDRMVRDPFGFIAGTAENIKKMHGLKKATEQKDRQCPPKTKSPSPQQSSPREKPEKRNNVSLVDVMKERALARSALKDKQPQSSVDT